MRYEQQWRDPTCSERLPPPDAAGNVSIFLPLAEPGDYTVEAQHPGTETCITVYRYDNEGNVEIEIRCSSGRSRIEIDHDPDPDRDRDRNRHPHRYRDAHRHRHHAADRDAADRAPCRLDRLQPDDGRPGSGRDLPASRDRRGDLVRVERPRRQPQ